MYGIYATYHCIGNKLEIYDDIKWMADATVLQIKMEISTIKSYQIKLYYQLSKSLIESKIHLGMMRIKMLC